MDGLLALVAVLAAGFALDSIRRPWKELEAGRKPEPVVSEPAAPTCQPLLRDFRFDFPQDDFVRATIEVVIPPGCEIRGAPVVSFTGEPFGYSAFSPFGFSAFSPSRSRTAGPGCLSR